jgi:Cu-processing system permease protein
MTALATSVSERPEISIISTIARKELRTTVASKWFWMWGLAFVGLAAILVTVALPDSRLGTDVGFGRTAASLVTLVQIIVPPMGLTLGAMSIAGQKESGALRFLMSHPVSRTEAFWGTYLGLAGALALAAGSGFGIAGVLTAMRGVSAGASTFVWIAALSWLLSIGMLGLGMLISTFTTMSGSALGVAIFVWLVMVFIGDLGLMGTSAATGMPTAVLFSAALFNPVEVFRLTALASFSGSLDVLGPAGTYAVDTFGTSLLPSLFAVLLLWVTAPVTVAWIRFKGRSDL